VIAVALAVVLAGGGGVWAERRWPVRAGDAARTVLRMMLYVLVPPVVFFNLVRMEFDAEVGAGLGVAWVVVLLSGAIAFLVARWMRLDRPRTGAVVNATLHPNTGYLGLPLCAALLGTEHLDEAVVYDVLVGTPTLLLLVFAVGAALGTQAGDTVADRVRAFFTRNPPLIAALLALLAPDSFAPDALVDASRVLVFALLPLGFWAVGVTLAEEPRFPPPMTRRLGAALGLRLVVAPALLLALSAPFFDIPDAYLLLAAMPTGINGLVVAHAYGLDFSVASGAVAYGTSLVLVVATALAVVT
jgi:predicted permease